MVAAPAHITVDSNRNTRGLYGRLGELAFGFILTTLLVPGITGAGTTPRWAFAAIALPLLARDRKNEFTAAHMCGFIFLCCAGLSVMWSHLWDGLDAFIKLVVIAEAFWVGTKLDDLKPVLIGFGLGIWASSVVMLTGIDVPQADGSGLPGLFVNSNVMGEIAGLVLVAVLVYEPKGNRARSVPCKDGSRLTRFRRGVETVIAVTSGERPAPLFWLIPGILPALILSHSRGAFLAVVCALGVWLWGRSKMAVLGIIALGAVGLALGGTPTGIGQSSINTRLEMWTDVLPHLSVMGWGIGSTFTIFPLFATMDTLALRPEHLHNDWLEYGFETGFIGAAVVSAFALSLFVGKGNRAAKLCLLCLFIEGCVGFPTHMAATAVLGGICAGHAVRDGLDIHDHFHAWRISLRQGASSIGHKLGYFRIPKGSKGLST